MVCRSRRAAPASKWASKPGSPVRRCAVTSTAARSTAARFDLVTKPSLAGRRVGAHVDETFLIPAADGQIHHIRAGIRPFVTR